jgi:hypothetical protein
MTGRGKHIRKLTTLIFLTISCLGVKGQEGNGVLDRISQKFVNYCMEYPWEEIYIQTDREEYISGEDLWFNAYLIDRQSGKPGTESTIVYFEILNYDNRPVVQKRIRLEQGSGPGEIQLSDTLGSGEYLIRAYTNRMRNYLPSNCFMKKITIYNSLSNQEFKSISKLTTLTSDSADPGGSNASNDGGLRIRINGTGSGNRVLNIETTSDFRLTNNNICYMLIQSRGRISYKSTFNLSENITLTTLPGTVFIPGISQVVLFDATGLPVAEKYLFTPAGKPENASIAAPVSCKKREKISIEVELSKELLTKSGAPELSISVAESVGKSSPGIDEYIVFGSEFGAIPDEISELLPGDIPDQIMERFLATIKSSWIDWKSILSGSHPTLKYPGEREFHYLSGRLMNRNIPVTGADKYVFLSIPGKKASFRYAKTDEQGNFSFMLPVTGESRDIIIQPEFIEKDITIKMESSFSGAYPQAVSVPDTLPEEFRNHLSRQGANYQVIKIYRSGQEENSPVTTALADGLKRFYGRPDIELIMDDYIKLPVMQEVFFELLPGVSLRKKREEYEVTIADPVEIRIYDKPPVLFVDGVVVNDPAVIGNLDPELVEQIDVVKERYAVGDFIFYGLVNIISRAGDYSCVELPEYAIRMPYRVADPVRVFSSPAYSDTRAKGSRLPDLRHTLFWNPEVKPDAGGKARIEFWSSDYATDYVVNIRGITPDGRTIILRKNVKIKVG